MKILLLHNYYQQAGGEDAVFHAERTLLEEAGHDVILYEKENHALTSLNSRQKLRLAQQTIWSKEAYAEISDLIQNQKPQIAHFTNFFPQISPSAYYACKRAGVGTVQSLHNYRLLCPGATFTRNGKICTDCLGKRPWRAVWHRCYRHSFTQSGTLVAMLMVHRELHTWEQQVDAFIALTPFMKDKMVQGGLPAHKIFVKPNCLLTAPNARQHAGNYALYVGRLSPEKGVKTLVKAWEGVELPLNIIGDGPERDSLQVAAAEKKIVFTGWMENGVVMEALKSAQFLIFPSEWYEGFPMTLLEAFAYAVPVIVARVGGLADIVQDGVTGLFFTAGDAQDLRDKINWALNHPVEMEKMGGNGRKQYENKYSAQTNYKQLIQIYHTVRAQSLPPST